MDRRGSSEQTVIAWLGTAALISLALLFIMRWVLQDEREKDPIVVMGGGFLFNYRISEISYGVTAGVARAIPVGSRLFASFEDPAGGPPIETDAKLEVRRTRVFLTSGKVRGVIKDRPYHVSLILKGRNGDVLWSKELAYRSRLDGDMIGDEPLTIGPGYTPNPKLQPGSAGG
ncbi:hypothetical protein [Notoacmeibacter sp. MSK16QG-6]|uniref:hypothetical protein n=1 Tax=Notoacmeibacter sp. MSK16QG-6 TaxID=2957982 RepID=UPI0020A07199|nr:hypothetical protein [Notoacmeibacter sp. MSK16QG-6]MCP1198601.1 hypothetical protein [Notoacmeibacter sp. MSK16QG-6]